MRLATGEVVAVYEDVSEQKQAEAHLRESEKRFRDLIESLPNIAVRGYDRDRRVIFWNASSERLYGYTRTEAEGRKLEDLIIPREKRSLARESITRWMNQGGRCLHPRWFSNTRMGGMCRYTRVMCF